MQFRMVTNTHVNARPVVLRSSSYREKCCLKLGVREWCTSFPALNVTLATERKDDYHPYMFAHVFLSLADSSEAAVVSALIGVFSLVYNTGAM